jgi:hypothetical protein
MNTGDRGGGERRSTEAAKARSPQDKGLRRQDASSNAAANGQITGGRGPLDASAVIRVDGLAPNRGWFQVGVGDCCGTADRFRFEGVRYFAVGKRNASLN